MKTNSLSRSHVIALECHVFLRGFLNANTLITLYMDIMCVSGTPQAHTVESKEEKNAGLYQPIMQNISPRNPLVVDQESFGGLKLSIRCPGGP